MAESTIPVDLLNPGQVFACLGLLEAADLLLGGAVGGFVRSAGTNTSFRLSANGQGDPLIAGLAFLADPAVDLRAVSRPCAAVSGGRHGHCARAGRLQELRQVAASMG